MLTDVPLRTGLTPAVIAGEWVKMILGWGSIVALTALGITVAVIRRRRRENAGPRRDRRRGAEGQALSLPTVTSSPAPRRART